MDKAKLTANQKVMPASLSFSNIETIQNNPVLQAGIAQDFLDAQVRPWCFSHRIIKKINGS
ncbi:MAG: hypothetical protein EOM68_31435 [Spirochaetia bacterium]|nr:hypothetical protein [Spirochaetia bacterium]